MQDCYTLGYSAAACRGGTPPSCVVYCTGLCEQSHAPFALSACALALLLPVPKWVAPEQFGMHASMLHAALMPVAAAIYVMGGLAPGFAPAVVAGTAVAIFTALAFAARAWLRHGVWVAIYMVPRSAVIASLFVVVGLGVSGNLQLSASVLTSSGWDALPCVYSGLAASLVTGIACAAHHKIH